MRFKTWPVAALGLGGLLLLVIVSMVTVSRRTQEIYDQLDRLNTHHREIEARLRRLRGDVHLSGIFVRDYLLDQERARGQEYRERLAEFWGANITTLAELEDLAGDQLGRDRISRLQERLGEYWQGMEPLFDWTPAEKLTQSARFLRREVVPRREAVLAIAREIEDLNNANLATQRREVTNRYELFRDDLYSLRWQSVLLGLIVAASSVIRLRMLEQRSEQQRVAAEQAEGEMRRLSQQLVAAQEDERKKLSRELHDHIGQMLTALRMEVGRIGRLATAGDRTRTDAVTECKRIVDDVMRTVRDLALGLRPAMLDDLGLRPALEWHVRDFNRRFGVSVHLAIDGTLDALPDAHRTCVYRIVQEALTNCVRHALADRIEVRVVQQPGSLDISIVDDGVGLDAASSGQGFGLRGLEERVRELNGTMQIHGRRGAGTNLNVVLPLEAAGVVHARVAS